MKKVSKISIPVIVSTMIVMLTSALSFAASSKPCIDFDPAKHFDIGATLNASGVLRHNKAIEIVNRMVGRITEEAKSARYSFLLAQEIYIRLPEDGGALACPVREIAILDRDGVIPDSSSGRKFKVSGIVAYPTSGIELDATLTPTAPMQIQ